MKCLKCGKSVPAGQVFCDDCRKEMAAYPVKPDTPVHLPPQQPPAPVRKPVKRARKPEETIARQRKLIRGLSISCAVLFLLFLLSGVGIAALWKQRRQVPLGQNYTTAQPTAPTAGGTTP